MNQIMVLSSIGISCKLHLTNHNTYIYLQLNLITYPLVQVCRNQEGNVERGLLKLSLSSCIIFFISLHTEVFLTSWYKYYTRMLNLACANIPR